VAKDIAAVVSLLSALIVDSGKRRLPRDFRAILDKAGRADVGQPYPSAHSLMADLRAYIEGRPVSARRATPAYRASLFARRRPELFYPAMVLLASVLAASAYSLAMNAAAQRSRTQAQYRLQELQKLTYSLESDLYRPVSALPNSKAATDTLIHWTAESLDGIAAQAGNDPQLRSQLARSYRRLAEVERSNRDEAAARISEGKADKILVAR